MTSITCALGVPSLIELLCVLADNGLSFATAEQLGRALPRCDRLRVITCQ